MRVFNDIVIPTDPEEGDIIELQKQIRQNVDSINISFDKFQESCNNVLDKAAELLRKKIDADPSQLPFDMSEQVAIQGSLSFLYADAEAYKTIYEVLHFCKRAKGTGMLKDDAILYTRLKTLFQSNLLYKLKNAIERLDKKITIWQSTLKYQTELLKKEG